VIERRLKMARVVLVKIVDEQNAPVAGQQVRTSDMKTEESLVTGADGRVNLLIASDSVSLTVNGKTVYEGEAAALDREAVFTLEGKRL
jgi:hypothetical protein